MAALTVTGYDSGGTGHSLTQLLSFGWECSKSSPYASLELSALDVPGANWFHRLEVSLNGSQLFSGRMDTQVWEQTVSGSLCRLTARSATAALVDNEAAPVAYQNYSLDQLLFDHAYPYGVTGSTLSGGTLSQILCTKGMSHWDFLQFYCRLLLGYLPWVNEEGILMGRQDTGEGVSFVQGDYESFTLSLNRTGFFFPSRRGTGSGKGSWTTSPGNWCCLGCTVTGWVSGGTFPEMESPFPAWSCPALPFLGTAAGFTLP